ncbi:signal peptidase I [Candidatus Woesearchaeota archaeon]|nr:signal peptidase I [Candidatus Woesearchaeota archaeon]
MGSKNKKNPYEGKSTWGKIWHFIWDDDSVWSWLVNIVLAFVIIKFLVYPGLGFIFQTSHPIVAVVSGSMEHDGSFDDWWQVHQMYYADLGITREEFLEFDFKNGFNTGDIMVLYGKDPGKIEAGDVIVYRSMRPDPIIHRVVEVWDEDGEMHFHTKGDHNTQEITDYFLNGMRVSPDTEGAVKYLDERDIPENDYIGKAAVRIPWLGYVKIIFVKLVGFMISLIR